MRSDKRAQSKIVTNAIEVTLLASVGVAMLFILLNVIFDFELASTMALYFFAVAFGSLVLNVARGWAWGSRWEPLLADFILLGQKLEQLGFTYYNGAVTVIEPGEVQNV